MDYKLVIPGHLNEWAEKWPRLADFLGSDYAPFLRAAYEGLDTGILYRSDTHGPGHIERAMLFGAMFAQYEGLSPELTEDLLLCCAWHDIGRTDDHYDEEHGRKSAERAEKLELTGGFHNPREALAAIHTHAKPDSRMPEVEKIYSPLNHEVFMTLAKGLKDADNLDRVRIYDLDTSFLRSPGTLELVPMAEWILAWMQYKKSVLCYGDSNTYGYNPYTGDRYPEYLRWPNKLQQLLGPTWRVIPEGLNGRTTAFERKDTPWLNGLSTIDPVLRSSFPVDVLIIMLGTNDCCAELDLSAEEITAGLAQLVDRARAHLAEIQSDEPKIILVAPRSMDETVLHGAFEGEMNEKSIAVSKQLPETYRALAEEKGCLFLSLEDTPKLADPDGEHFFTFGGQMLAKKLAELIGRNGL